jgi:hypothetical protein
MDRWLSSLMAVTALVLALVALQHAASLSASAPSSWAAETATLAAPAELQSAAAQMVRLETLAACADYGDPGLSAMAAVYPANSQLCARLASHLYTPEHAG